MERIAEVERHYKVELPHQGEARLIRSDGDVSVVVLLPWENGAPGCKVFEFKSLGDLQEAIAREEKLLTQLRAAAEAAGKVRRCS